MCAFVVLFFVVVFMIAALAELGTGGVVLGAGAILIAIVAPIISSKVKKRNERIGEAELARLRERDRQKLTSENKTGSALRGNNRRVLTIENRTGSVLMKNDGQRTPTENRTAPIADMSKVDKMDGVEFENFVASLLRQIGYRDVKTTKASGDYGVDILAYSGTSLYAFQCKRHEGNVGTKSIQEIFAGVKMYHADIAVVVTNSHFTQNAMTLAKELNVSLWDRVTLMNFMGVVDRKVEISDSKPTGMLAKETDNQKPELAQPPVSIKAEPKPKPKEETSGARRKGASFDMPVRLGAGRYVFGENIPLGIYNLKAISGYGTLTMQKLKGTEWGEDWFDFGKEEGYVKSYHGLSLPQGKWFEVDGDVVFEISKAKMLEID